MTPADKVNKNAKSSFSCSRSLSPPPCLPCPALPFLVYASLSNPASPAKPRRVYAPTAWWWWWCHVTYTGTACPYTLIFLVHGVLRLP